MADGSTGGIVLRERGLFVRELRTEMRQADFIASTDAVDSYDEVIDQQSWDLKRYKANPVVLWSHDKCELPIGKATRVEVVNGQLECTIEFAPMEANDDAEEVWQLVKGGFLRAVSVGFIPRDIRWEKRNDEEVYVLSNCELFEISVVTVPANADCLAKTSDALSGLKAEARLRGLSTTPSAPRGATEKPMTEEEMKAAVAAKDAELAALKAENEDIKAKAAEAHALSVKAMAEPVLVTGMLATEESDAVVAKAIADRDAAAEKAALAEKRVAELEAKVLASEVEALVGTKILPAQKDAYVAIAKADRTAYDALVATLPDLNVTKSVMGDGAKEALETDGDLADALDEEESTGTTAASEVGDLADDL